jgi:hypothetical protein
LIPRLIHQIWVGPKPLPEEYAALIDKTKAMHPNWEHRLWTEKTLPDESIRSEWRNKLRMPAERSDLLRLELLYKFGGIYLDVDFALLKPLDPLLELAPIVVCDLKPGRVNNAFIASVPGHPIIRTMISEATPREFFGLDKRASGSLFVDRMLKPHRNSNQVNFLPPVCFYSTSPNEESYAMHFFDRSWKDEQGWKRAALLAEDRLKAANSRIEELEKVTAQASRSKLPPRPPKRESFVKRVRRPAREAVLNARFALAEGASRFFDVPLHRHYLPAYLNRLNLTGTGAEIGVKRGVHSEAILSRWKGKKLYLVDPWEEQRDTKYVDRANVVQAKHDEHYQETLQRMARFKRRVEIIRDYSENAAKRFPANSLDFVYLDARHDYDSVLADLRNWEPKVKVGGLIAGHDYLQGTVNRMPYGVKAAVRHYMNEQGYLTSIVKRTWEPWPSFYWIKPSKGNPSSAPSSLRQASAERVDCTSSAPSQEGARYQDSLIEKRTPSADAAVPPPKRTETRRRSFVREFGRTIGPRIVNTVRGRFWPEGFESGTYWENRYLAGKTSGKGSYGLQGDYKAEAINRFVSEHNVQSVVEHGCGDGHQASLFEMTSYLGIDVARTAVDLARRRNRGRPGFRFEHIDECAIQDASFELALSLDVIYHLVEDDIYHNYMDKLFRSSSKYVIIYATNYNSYSAGRHIRHRRFTRWVEVHAPQWRLTEVLKNPYSIRNVPKEHQAKAQFHFYSLSG